MKSKDLLICCWYAIIILLSSQINIAFAEAEAHVGSAAIVESEIPVDPELLGNTKLVDVSYKKSRPTIALVLAGGGAKGAAHIGVLKALEEMYVPVDIITGTSMGAYIGGLYATGMSADEIESLIYSTKWNDGYRDRVDRSELRVIQKLHEDHYQINTDLGVRFGELRSPKGVVQGQGMMQILRVTSGNLPTFESFDQLPIQYRAVATDIIDLKPVVLEKGLLTDAMMASMSVPGALPPYEIDGRLLVDGGVTNNMPVDLAKELGADIVIAVDISTEYFNKEQMNNFVTVGGQLSNYLVRRTTDEQTQYLTDQDTLLRPTVGDMETMEFDKMPAAYTQGYEVAQKEKQALSRYSVSTSQYQQYIDHKEKLRRELIYGDDLVVDRITLNNYSHYDDRLVLNKLDIETGSKISTESLEKSVRNLYAIDRFETVAYHFETNNDETNLIIDVKEKEWGPNYMNFRLFVEEDFASDSEYSLGFSTNFTGLNSAGAELQFNLDFGTDRRVALIWESPFLFSPSLMNMASVVYNKDQKSTPIDGYLSGSPLDMTDNSLSTTYTDFTIEAAIGYQPEFWHVSYLGLRYIDGSANLTTLPILGNADYTRRGAFVHYRLDTLDDYSLPTSGFLVDLDYFISDDSVSGSRLPYTDATEQIDYSHDVVHEISAKFRGAVSFDKHTWVAAAEYGVVADKSSNNPPIQPKELGGFLRLSGISRDSLVGDNLLFTSLVYRYKWFDNDFGLFTAPVYYGASLEYGGVWSDTDVSASDAPLYMAGSVFAGVASPIGPIVFAFGMTEENHQSYYLILGQTF
ncbi:patatin-like phospholipase family protein [Vibrio sp. TH_r3]|uniref:patatin-like phospholipase family protein n=1 Tax=Vibrio sp. TH_r3 TaxID=3082084 RepID=UPI002952C81B|nr:patatin-like phospholipase family protein [Vibrio sp. TH_r3]MDV7104440.1 patatin-like phospholipase family protein [Vibrio sp. TH_r3]